MFEMANTINKDDDSSLDSGEYDKIHVEESHRFIKKKIDELKNNSDEDNEGETDSNSNRSNITCVGGRSLKFLSIHDILFGDCVSYRQSRGLNLSKNNKGCGEEEGRLFNKTLHSDSSTELSVHIGDRKKYEHRYERDSCGNENIEQDECCSCDHDPSENSMEKEILEEPGEGTDTLKSQEPGSENTGTFLPWWEPPLWSRAYHDTTASPLTKSDHSKMLLSSLWAAPQRTFGERLELTEKFPVAGMRVGPNDKKTTANKSTASATNTATSRSKTRRQRQAYTVTQLSSLEEEFKNNRYLSSDKRETLSQSLGLSENQVKAWFQNRRTKHKKLTNQQKPSTSRELSESVHDVPGFLFPSSPHSLSTVPFMPPFDLHGLNALFARSGSTHTPYLNLIQRML